MQRIYPTRRQAVAALSALPLLPRAALAAAESRLKEAAQRLDIRTGSAVNFVNPVEDDYLALIARECAMVSPENAGKWKWIEPTPGNRRWGAMDRTVDFARRNGLKTNWHTLMWQNGGMPEFMLLPEVDRPSDHPAYDAYYSPDGTLSVANYWPRYRDFTSAIAERYKDIFYRIDVANEPFLPHGSYTPDDLIDANGFRKGNWWHVAGGSSGPAWMDRFFEDARRQFPTAKLVVNEFGVEAVHSQEREKRGYLLDWLEGAVMRGCPIDGVGLQSHLSVRNNYDEASMAAFARRMQELGLSIFITELDVDTRGLPDGTGTAERDRLAGDLAARHVRTMLENGDLKEITWWGISSGSSFLAKRGGEEALEPTLFDAAFNPMPMYNAVCQVLEAAA